MIKIRHCQHCGAEFRSRSGVQKYCSIQCTESAKYEKRKSRENLLRGIEAMADAQRQDYLTFSKAAVLMGCSRQYIYKLVAQGRLNASRLSSRMAFVRRSDIEELLDENPYTRVLPIGAARKSSSNKSTTSSKASESNSDEPIEYYTSAEIVKKYKVNQNWFYTTAVRNGVRRCKVARTIYFNKQDVDAYFKTDDAVEIVNEWFTAEEAAKHYGSTSGAIKVQAHRKSIPTKREFGKTYYSKDHLDKLYRLDVVNNPDYCNSTEACELLGVTSANILQIIKKYKIGHEKVGKDNFLLRADVAKAADDRKARGIGEK